MPKKAPGISTAPTIVSFESFGVTTEIECESEEDAAIARSEIMRAFGHTATLTEPAGNASVFIKMGRDAEGFWLDIDDEFGFRRFDDREVLFRRYLNSHMRIEMASRVDHRVFVHSGSVGVDGKAILIPGFSFSGKSTLTSELVKNGAVYYSDEYAVIDEDGLIHPFPRDLMLRNETVTVVKELTAGDLGGTIGVEPIPVGLILFTKYQENADWQPRRLTVGEAIMELIPHTLSVRRSPGFAMRLLEKITQNALLLAGPRGESADFAKKVLEIFKDSKLQ